MEKSNKVLLAAFIVVLLAVASLSIIGIFSMTDKKIVLQGQIEADEYKISGLLPGRIEQIYVAKGQRVNKGDTLVHIISREALAEYDQQKALEKIAISENKKVDAGTRSQLIAIAGETWKGAKADLSLAKSTFERIKILYGDSIVTLQRRDEAEALYKTALSAERAAAYQYQMALEGVRPEDREASQAMVEAAESSTGLVAALLTDSKLTAPTKGEINSIALNVGELTSIGTTIMTIITLDDVYMVLNVREDLMPYFSMGQSISCDIPAIAIKDMAFIINYISPLGSFATWKSTKQTGGFDLRTFQIHARPVHPAEGLRPGMSVLLTLNPDNIK